MSNKKKLLKAHADLVIVAKKLEEIFSLLVLDNHNNKCSSVADHIQEAAYQLGDAMKLIAGKSGKVKC